VRRRQCRAWSILYEVRTMIAQDCLYIRLTENLSQIARPSSLSTSRDPAFGTRFPGIRHFVRRIACKRIDRAAPRTPPNPETRHTIPANGYKVALLLEERIARTASASKPQMRFPLGRAIRVRTSEAEYLIRRIVCKRIDRATSRTPPNSEAEPIGGKHRQDLNDEYGNVSNKKPYSLTRRVFSARYTRL
jgi:hypothetical protein